MKYRHKEMRVAKRNQVSHKLDPTAWGAGEMGHWAMFSLHQSPTSLPRNLQGLPMATSERGPPCSEPLPWPDACLTRSAGQNPLRQAMW